MKTIPLRIPMLACFVFAASLMFAGPAPADDDRWGFSIGPYGLGLHYDDGHHWRGGHHHYRPHGYHYGHGYYHYPRYHYYQYPRFYSPGLSFHFD